MKKAPVKKKRKGSVTDEVTPMKTKESRMMTGMHSTSALHGKSTMSNSQVYFKNSKTLKNVTRKSSTGRKNTSELQRSMQDLKGPQVKLPAQSF